MHKESSFMRPRFVSTAVLCFAAVLFAGCTCGVQREGGALGNRASSESSAGLVAQPTARTSQVQWVKWAAAFRDHGRYYK